MKHNQIHLSGIFDATQTIRNNHLFYGDNLTIMKEWMPDNSVDLIYLDPPFNSQRNYNLIYKKLTGQPVPEQEEAFCDAWEMDPEKDRMAREMPEVFHRYGAHDDLVRFWRAWIDALRNTQPRLLAYLVYMSYRLFEMRRILKPTGSLYLHCDPTASHYIKVILDGIFGHKNFRNEIIWKRTTAKGHASTRFASNHDVILCYSKTETRTWNPQYTPHDPTYIENFYKYIEPETGRRYSLDNLVNPNPNRPNLTYEFLGVTRVWRWTKSRMENAYNAGLIVQSKPGSVPRLKRYLDEQEGTPIDDVWSDISPVGAQASERLGYPTQKPIALLERILNASSNPGDVVFDPFCGCGTAIYAAHLLGRKWIGCDIAILSVRIVRDVLFKRYGLKEDEHYTISGIPLSVEGAEDMFKRDPRQFQNWAVELAGGFASTKYSGDQGIDGRIYFETRDGLKNMVLSVKGGGLTPAFVREVRGALVNTSDTMLTGFICLQPPTKAMKQEAAAAGLYDYLGTAYERLQIRTIEELLNGMGFHTPSKVQTLNWIEQLPLPLVVKNG